MVSFNTHARALTRAARHGSRRLSHTLTALAVAIPVAIASHAPPPVAAAGNLDARIFRDSDEVILADRAAPVAWLGFGGDHAYYINETNPGTIANEYGFGPLTSDDILADVSAYPSTLRAGAEEIDVAVGYVMSELTDSPIDSPDAFRLYRRGPGDWALDWYGPQSEGLPLIARRPLDEEPIGVEVVGRGGDARVVIALRADGQTRQRDSFVVLRPVATTVDGTTTYRLGDAERTNLEAGAKILDLDHQPTWAASPFGDTTPAVADSIFGVLTHEVDGLQTATVQTYYWLSDTTVQEFYRKDDLNGTTIDRGALRYQVMSGPPTNDPLGQNANIEVASVYLDDTTVTAQTATMRDPSTGEGSTVLGWSTDGYCPNAVDMDALFHRPGDYSTGVEIAVTCVGVTASGTNLRLRALRVDSGAFGNPSITTIPVKGDGGNGVAVDPRVTLSAPCQELWRVRLEDQVDSDVRDWKETDFTNDQLCSAATGAPNINEFEPLVLPDIGNITATVVAGVAPVGTPVGSSLSTARESSMVVVTNEVPRIGVLPNDQWRTGTNQRPWYRELPAGMTMERLPSDPLELILDLDQNCDVGASAPCTPSTVEGDPVPVAVLVAPPLVAGAGQEPSGPPQFAKSSTTSDGSTEVSSFRIGGYAGVDFETNDGLNEFEFSLNYEHEISSAASRYAELTQTQAYGGSTTDDVIVFNSTTFWRYDGTIVTDTLGFGDGGRGAYHRPIGTSSGSGEYHDLQQEFPDSFGPDGLLAESMDRILSHSIGDPGSYLPNEAAINDYCIGNVAGTSELSDYDPRYYPTAGRLPNWLTEGSNSPAGPMFDNQLLYGPVGAQRGVLLSEPFHVRAGSGNSETAGVELVEGRETEFLATNSIDVEIGSTLAGFTSGLTTGGTWGSGWSFGVSTGTSFEGTVAGIPNAELEEETYDWRMFLCKKEVLVGAPVWVLNYQVENYHGSGGLEALSDIELRGPTHSQYATLNPTLQFAQEEGTVEHYEIDVEAIGAEHNFTLADSLLAWESTVDSKLNRPDEIELTLADDHTLLPNQLYRWRTRGVDFFGNTVSSAWEFFVTVGAPTSDFGVTTANPGYGIVNEPIDLASTGDSGGLDVTHRWSLPDGATATGPTATWTPSTAGVHPIVLTVTNDYGSDSHTEFVVVAPQATDDAYRVAEDTTLAELAPGVLANDDGATEALVVDPPTRGELDLALDGGFTWEPEADTCAADGDTAFTYRARGNSIASLDTAVVSISVTCVNDPPTHTPTSSDIDEDLRLAEGAPGLFSYVNDVDNDASELSIEIVTDPDHGQLALDPDGSWWYEPAADFCGSDSFTYRAFDGTDWSDAEPVPITVHCVNDAPVASGFEVTTDEDEAISVDTPGLLDHVSDVDHDLADLSVELTAEPEHGNATVGAGGAWSYSPDAGFCGPDTFGYRAYDGQFYSEPAFVMVAIACVNDPPVASGFGTATLEDTTLSVAAPGLLGFVTDIDNDVRNEVTLDITQPVDNGSLTINEDGSWEYLPDPDFCGLDGFWFRAFDGEAYSDSVGVAIGVDCVNDAPVANDDTIELSGGRRELSFDAPGVLANDSDVDGPDSLVVTLVDTAENGDLSLAANGSFTYRPQPSYCGADSFTYTVSDGEATSQPATVQLVRTCRGKGSK